MTIPFPKEHGVWAMLAVSVIIGSGAAGSFTTASAALSISLFFLLTSKAPIRSLLRGDDKNSIWWCLAYLTLSGLFMLPMIPLMSIDLFILTTAVMLPAVPIYLYAMWKKREMRIGYEIPAMLLLALAAPFAYAAAGGTQLKVMLILLALCFLYYAASSFRVRSTPGSKSLKAGLAYDTLLIAGVAMAASSALIPPLAALGFLPILENAWRALSPKKEKLSQLGRVEVIKIVIFATFMIAGYRA
jgi:hypothetical protein